MTIFEDTLVAAIFYFRPRTSCVGTIFVSSQITRLVPKNTAPPRYFVETLFFHTRARSAVGSTVRWLVHLLNLAVQPSKPTNQRIVGCFYVRKKSECDDDNNNNNQSETR
jgi:hypothetical protein